MPLSPPLLIPTPRTRKLVEKLLVRAVDPNEYFNTLGSILGPLERLGDRMVATLIEYLNDLDEFVSTTAAWMLLHAPKHLVGDYLKTAERIVNESLASTIPHLAENTCILLFHLSKENIFDNSLRECLKHQDEIVRIISACVLSRSAANAEAINAMRELLYDLNRTDMLPAIVATEFLRMDLERQYAINVITDRLPRMDPIAQHIILLQLGYEDFQADELIPILASLIASNTTHERIARGAARALGRVGRYQHRVKEILLDLVTTTNPAILGGVVDGFTYIANLPETLTNSLLLHLPSPNEDLRWEALKGLQILEMKKISAIAPLIEQFQQESNPQLHTAVAEAIAAIGYPAIEPLLDLVRTGDCRILGSVGGALVLMGDIAVAPVINALSIETDDANRNCFVAIIMGFGRKAAISTPTLCELLRETEDEVLAASILRCLYTIGPAAWQSAESVIEFLCDHSGDLAEYCEDVLRILGFRITPTVEKAMTWAPPKAKIVLERTLKWLRPDAVIETTVFTQVSLELVQLFVIVGDILTDSNEMSWQRVSDRIINNYPEKKKGIRPRRLSMKIEMLIEPLGHVKLIDSSQKGRLALTHHGKARLKEARQYLKDKVDSGLYDG